MAKKTNETDAPKNFTIKLAEVADIDKFNEIKSEKKLSQSGTFNLILKTCNTEVNSENTEGLLKEIENLKQVNLGLLTEKEGLLTSSEQVNLQLSEALEKIATLEKEKLVLQEVIVELEANPKVEYTEKQLTGLQFICEPSEEVFKMARKCRPFLREDKRIDGEDHEYPSKLFNISVAYYLRNKYDHIVG
jgi:hypothetical protein